MPNIVFYIQFASLSKKTNLSYYLFIMENVKLTAEVRGQEEKVREMRQDKTVPGVVYGRTQEPISIKLNNSDVLRAYRQAGESTIINLKVGKKDIEVLFHDIQKHPRTDAILHVDFFALTRGEKLHTNIALNFIGNSPAKREGAIIEEYIREIEVKCLPRDLVAYFDVNLELLKEFGDTITIADLHLDETKYEIHHHEEDVVAIASKPRVEVVEDTAPEAAEVGDSSKDKEETEDEEK